MSRLVLGEDAAMIRRQVGAASWCALEELAARGATSTNDGHVSASVRDVADALGISKNAAHRAISRLANAGLIDPAQSRSSDGRFLPGTYRLTVPTDVLHPISDEPASTTRTNRRTNRPRRDHIDDTTQLSLLTP